MKVYSLFGMSINATSHEEAMDKFKLKNFTRPSTTQAYVDELAVRVMNFCGVNLGHYISIADFVDRMIEHGLMKVQE